MRPASARSDCVLPDDLPVPQDDGAARHLAGMRLPDIALAGDRWRAGRSVEAQGPHRRLRLSAHRPCPGSRCPTGWDAIPGARGCTPQSCGFRDHFAELKRLGVAQLYGLSTQDTDYQREAVERLHLPFAILSDAELAAHPRAQAADLRGRRHDAAQAHGLGDRRRRDRARCSIRCFRRTRAPRKSSPGFRRRGKRAPSANTARNISGVSTPVLVL